MTEKLGLVNPPPHIILFYIHLTCIFFYLSHFVYVHTHTHIPWSHNG